MRSWLKDYFTFSRRDRNALIILIFILVVIISLYFILPYFTPSLKTDFSNFDKEVRLLDNFYKKSHLKSDSSDYSKSNPILQEMEKKEIKYYDFDPNKATYKEWEYFGVTPWVIKNIIHYREKGGKFYKKVDLKKIYGFDLDIYQELEPHIVINDSLIRKKIQVRKQSLYNPKAEKKFIIVEINSAGLDELGNIKGINPFLAKNILKYRDLLGGYYNIQQLREVYGVDSVTFNKIKDNFVIDNVKISKISINLCDRKILSKHIYIGYKAAKKIIEFRDKHGPFASIADLRKFNLIENDHIYEKIYPYLILWE